MGTAFTTFVQQIITTFTALVEGMGSGISKYVENVFLDTSGSTTTLSAFGVAIAAFAGLAAGFGVVRFLFRWISSIGN